MASTKHTHLYVRDNAGNYEPASTEQIICTARAVLDKQLKRSDVFTGPCDVRAYVSLKLGELPYEVFGIIFVDAQHRVIEYREMFRGTLSQTSVYPREVVREALLLNAGAVLLVHNHPSGVPEPSRADELLTQALRTALALVDVRVLDHLVVGGGQVTSFAERGLL